MGETVPPGIWCGNAFLAPFSLMFASKRSIAKTGSGQTSEKKLSRFKIVVRFRVAGHRRKHKVRKTPLFAPFIYKNDHFTKTGSGQT